MNGTQSPAELAEQVSQWIGIALGAGVCIGFLLLLGLIVIVAMVAKTRRRK